MIVWCAYCQMFQKEVPPYDDYSLSHGICESCKKRGIEISDEKYEEILRLKSIQNALLQAGIDQDARAADDAMAMAVKAGTRKVDILMALMAPLLWQIGDRWARGEITFAEEHRVTSFYNAAIGRFESEISPSTTEGTSPGVDILILNAPNNVHSLGSRVMSLWLRSKGVRTIVHSENPTGKMVRTLVDRHRPKFLGISIALAEQFPAALDLIANLIEPTRKSGPAILFGGNAVKAGLLPETEGITFVIDPHAVLQLMAPET